jgi:hypothetical protein
MGMRYADLDPILEELIKKGRTSRLPSPTGKDMIILKKQMGRASFIHRKFLWP